MGWIESIILGIVQGLTEFLPVSSSGHLVVVPAVLGWDQPSLTFDLVLHLGTLVAVVAAFREELWVLALGVVGRGDDPRTARRLVGLLAVGSVPAAIAGLAFGSFFEERFDDPLATCGELLGTAVILLVAEWVIRRGEGHHPIDATRAGIIGVAQAVAILPGISRSGSTIGAGLVMKVSREDATRYSFLLAIPAIAGAVATKIPDVADGRFRITGPVVAGFLVSAVVGWASIAWLLRYVRTHSFVPFAVYLLVAAPIAAVIIELR
ncbi:MAG: undecaprenyl-diphosphate phosphatase [Actinomycetota bacterium]